MAEVRMDAPGKSLEQALQACTRLLDQEAAAIEEKNLEEGLDLLESIQVHKEEAVTELAKQIDLFGQSGRPMGSFQKRIQEVHGRMGENSLKLQEWMDLLDRDLAQASKGMNNAKRIRSGYVNPHKGRPGHSFDA
jgi:hypothetical protein